MDTLRESIYGTTSHGLTRLVSYYLNCGPAIKFVTANELKKNFCRMCRRVEQTRQGKVRINVHIAVVMETQQPCVR